MTENETPENRLVRTFALQEAAFQAEISFLRSITEHKGETGRLIETALSRLMEKTVPENFGVTTGFTMDRFGEMSNQCDILVYEKASTPFIFRGAISVIPIECLVVAVEVKTRINKKELKDIQSKSISIHQLARGAYIRSEDHEEKVRRGVNQEWEPKFYGFGVSSMTNSGFEKAMRECHLEDEFFLARSRLSGVYSLEGSSCDCAPYTRYFAPSSPLTYFLGQMVSDVIAYNNLKVDYRFYLRALEQ